MIYAMAVTLEGLRCEKQLPRFLPGATDFWAWLTADFSLNTMIVFQGQNMCMAWALRPPKPSLPYFPHRNQYLPKVGSSSCCFDSSSPLVREFWCSIPALLSSSPSCCVGCPVPVLPGGEAGDSSALCKPLSPHRCC